jgi:hypothetical protein
MKLIDSTKKDLIELCKLRNIKNYSKLNKNELIILLKKNKKGGETFTTDELCITTTVTTKNNYNVIGNSTGTFKCDAQKYLEKYIKSKHMQNNNSIHSIQLEENKHYFLYKKFDEDSKNNNNIITYGTCLSKYQYYISWIYDVQYHYLKKYNQTKIPICIPYKYIDFAKTMVDDIFNNMNTSSLFTYLTLPKNSLNSIIVNSIIKNNKTKSKSNNRNTINSFLNNNSNTNDNNSNTNDNNNLNFTNNDLYIVFYKKTKNNHIKYNASIGNESGYVKALKIDRNLIINKNTKIINNIFNEYKQTIINDFNENNIVTYTSYREKCFNKINYLRIIINGNSYCIKKDNKYIIKIKQNDLKINQVVIKNKDNKYISLLTGITYI